MKKTLLTLLILAIIGGGAYLYITRSGPAPSGNMPIITTPPSEQPTQSEIFVINAEKSEAKFEVNEVLTGKPFHVVGVTQDVSGQIGISSRKPVSSHVGTITINARTLKTDSDKRNGMISRSILKSEDNEFITFTPISTTGLPEELALNTDYKFKTMGKLTIAGVSKDVTFDITAKAASTSEIS